MNKLSIVGHITKDAELRKVNVAGVETPVATFTVAANYGRKNENGERQVQYVRVTAWRDFATKTAPYLKKGMQVFVAGPMRISVYKSNQDGTWRGTAEITRIEDFEFLSAQKKEEATPAAAPAAPEEYDDAEYPFE